AYDEALRATLSPPPMPRVAPAMTAVVVVPPEAPLVVEVPAPEAAPPFVAAPPGGVRAVTLQSRESAAGARRPPKDMTVEILKIVGGGLAGVVLATALLRLVFGIDMTGLFPVA